MGTHGHDGEEWEGIYSEIRSLDRQDNGVYLLCIVVIQLYHLERR
jgi:hypothetical protein